MFVRMTRRGHSGARQDHLRICHPQVEDSVWAHMVYAYVALQEGIVVEGESSITAAMKAALVRCAVEFRCSLNLRLPLPCVVT